MKRLLCVVILVCSLLGCGKNEGLDKGLLLRNAVFQGNGCAFSCVITADYGDRQYDFSEICEVNTTGNLQFVVSKPDTISGIGGTVSGEGGKLTFDDQMLAFPLLPEGLLTPVSAPWYLLHSLKSGYINACETNKDGIQLVIQDSFQETPVETHIYCDNSSTPYFAEIYWEGSRIITLQIADFEIL